MDEFDVDSVFSHEERAVAAMLAEGESVAAIAEERDLAEETVERTVDRIRVKTDRALATLLQSPFAADAVGDLGAEARRRLDAL